jgi:hypothetical protein
MDMDMDLMGAGIFRKRASQTVTTNMMSVHGLAEAMLHGSAASFPASFFFLLPPPHSLLQCLLELSGPLLKKLPWLTI